MSALKLGGPWEEGKVPMMALGLGLTYRLEDVVLKSKCQIVNCVKF